jgi:hypothetical protein
MQSSCISTTSVADPGHFDTDPDPAFHFDTDPDPAFQFDTDPTVDTKSNPYHFERGNVSKTVILIHLYFLYILN